MGLFGFDTLTLIFKVKQEKHISIKEANIQIVTYIYIDITFCVKFL